ncbi:MAG: BTAD domain-containing putative transcriptional regulator [Acidimicrobiales bacterium]|nr:BTAD domain-containing putative transcriptional regulator [Acidimicrobiales bacterium]
MPQGDASNRRANGRTVSVLGPAMVDGASLSRRQRQIMAVLALHADQATSTDRLIDAVWSGTPPKSARPSLQNQIARLRSEFGPSIIRTGPDGYRLGGATDVEEFAAIARIPTSTPGLPADVVSRLERAMTLWRGRPYDDIEDVDGVDAARAQLEELHALVEERLAAHRLAIGDAAVHLDELASLVASEPYREHRWALLMTGLHRAGRTTEALEAFERLRTMLDDELGTAPTYELERLRGSIRRDALVAPAPAVDLRDDAVPASDSRGRRSGCGRRSPRLHRTCASA